MHIVLLLIGFALGCAAAENTSPALPPVLFNTAFESASIGMVEKLGDTEFRLHIRGQQDSRGRNRQATWFYFRMDDVAGRELTLHFTSFKGEYNDKPANSPAGDWYRPVFSEDNEHWTYFEKTTWDRAKDELTLTVHPHGNTVWLAHIPPYPYARVLALIQDVSRLPHARAEVIGQTVLGRPLHLITVTDFARPDAGKKIVWLQARQHAWECGTSFLMEGAIKFVTSDEPAARKLRDEVVFKFVPMINVDSVVRGEVRFNANGFDPNRQWNEVDLHDKRWLERNPEIWYVKKAMLAQHAQQPIDLALNLHNTETNEYVETMAATEPQLGMMRRFFARLMSETTFDPSRPELTLFTSGPGNTTNSVWPEAKVPIALMEQRIGPSQKAGHIISTEERLAFGRKLIAIMGEAAQ